MWAGRAELSVADGYEENKVNLKDFKVDMASSCLNITFYSFRHKNRTVEKLVPLLKKTFKDGRRELVFQLKQNSVKLFSGLCEQTFKPVDFSLRTIEYLLYDSSFPMINREAVASLSLPSTSVIVKFPEANRLYEKHDDIAQLFIDQCIESKHNLRKFEVETNRHSISLAKLQYNSDIFTLTKCTTPAILRHFNGLLQYVDMCSFTRNYVFNVKNFTGLLMSYHQISSITIDSTAIRLSAQGVKFLIPRVLPLKLKLPELDQGLWVPFLLKWKGKCEFDVTSSKLTTASEKFRVVNSYREGTSIGKIYYFEYEEHPHALFFEQLGVLTVEYFQDVLF